MLITIALDITKSIHFYIVDIILNKKVIPVGDKTDKTEKHWNTIANCQTCQTWIRLCKFRVLHMHFHGVY